jgi:hypothetical protein
MALMAIVIGFIPRRWADIMNRCQNDDVHCVNSVANILCTRLRAGLPTWKILEAVSLRMRLTNLLTISQETGRTDLAEILPDSLCTSTDLCGVPYSLRLQ